MFRIIVDSGANLPAELVKQYGIEVLSFVNYIDGSPISCYTPDISPEEERVKGKEYYDAMRKGLSVKTGLISIGEFEEAFRAAFAAGEDVICLSISSGISGTYNSARLAACEVMSEGYDGRTIRTIDTMNASLATGILAIYGSEMRAEGFSVNETADILESYVAGMNGVFTVGDLKFLSRTGRVAKSAALVGNALNIKPILRGDKEGHIVQFRKCRGRKGSLNDLIDLVCDNIIDPENQILGIAHADAYEDSLYVMRKITERVPVRGFINTTYDMCTGSHVGPDTIALFFMGADRELSGNGKDTFGRRILRHPFESINRILGKERILQPRETHITE